MWYSKQNNDDISLNSFKANLNNKIILDSGTTDHMFCNKKILTKLEPINDEQFVLVANGMKAKINGIGETNLLSTKITNILYLSSFSTNLISIPKLTRELNCSVIFSSKTVKFQDRETTTMIGERVLENDLYVLKPQEKKCVLAKSEDYGLWHKRLGHPSNKVLNSFFDNSLKTCINCDVCKLAKQTRLHFPLSTSKTQNIFELVHSDVWKSAPLISYNGFKYFVIFIDDFSRTTWLYLLRSKDEVFNCFEEFINRVQTQYNGKIKTFRSDNGTEFVNNKFSNLFRDKGIIHQTTCINTPEQNGVSERKNRHLLEVTRALLFQNNVPKVYWSDAILNANYLINRLPSAPLGNKIPLEVLFQRKININHLRIFGCVCFVKIKRKDKLDVNSIKTIFLGYSSYSKGYKCYDPIHKKSYISRDIIFVENESFFKEKNKIENQINPNTIDQANPILPQLYGLDTLENKELEKKIIEVEPTTQEEEASEGERSIEGEIEAKRSSRIPQPSTRLRDFVTYKVQYSIQDFISYTNISPKHTSFLTSITKVQELNTYQQAITCPIWTCPIWCKAMREELDALEKNKT
jgi:Integrase core domain/GAG-pre-integrase domain